MVPLLFVSTSYVEQHVRCDKRVCLALISPPFPGNTLSKIQLPDFKTNNDFSAARLSLCRSMKTAPETGDSAAETIGTGRRAVTKVPTALSKTNGTTSASRRLPDEEGCSSGVDGQERKGGRSRRRHFTRLGAETGRRRSARNTGRVERGNGEFSSRTSMTGPRRECLHLFCRKVAHGHPKNERG